MLIISFLSKIKYYFFSFKIKGLPSAKLELLIKTKIARLDGSIFKLFEHIAKAGLLILDDFGLSGLDKNQQMDLMEIIEGRHSRSATIIASQLPVANWYDVMGEATIADAILDRLVHRSHRIELKGESPGKKL